jgi:hypothetical protein
MVDLAIASNFARELTEEQFAQGRRTQRRRAAAEAGNRSTARTEASSPPAGRADAAPRALSRTVAKPERAPRARPAGPRSAFARVMSRLVQVRG